MVAIPAHGTALDIAKRHNLYVVEDAAHAPGAATWITDKDTGEAKKF
jgi:dTDP-4-amino-4,6-dideoxygalactose transaminase